VADPLQNLSCSIDDWGGNVALSWMYPATLPTNWQFFIFKEADQAVTDDQIAAYFAGSLSDQELKQLGIYVYRNLPVDPTYMGLIDWGVDNGIQYFYKGVIQDLDTKEISTSVQADATPQGNYSFNIPDVKSLLIRALEKAISSVGNASITAPVLGKHFKVQANYPREKAESLFIVVSRLPGQSAARYFSEVIQEYDDQIVRGELDIQVCEVAWVATEQVERRDKVTLLMMGYRQYLKHYLMKMGAGDIWDVKFLIAGDTEGTPPSGGNGVRGTMTAVFVVETKMQLGGVVLGNPVKLVNTYIGD